MKENIRRINQLIDNKRSSLKERAAKSFESISFPTALENSRRETISGQVKTPGLTYILYGVAIVIVIISFCSDEGKVLWWFLAILSAIIGFVFSKRLSSSKKGEVSSRSEDLSSIKTDTISKGINVVKQTTREWDDFMESTQKNLYATIDFSDLSDSDKDKLSSKIFSYEVIGINLSDLMSLINSATSTDEIQKNINTFKLKFLSAIDKAANNQINRYNSLFNMD